MTITVCPSVCLSVCVSNCFGHYCCLGVRPWLGAQSGEQTDLRSSRSGNSPYGLCARRPPSPRGPGACLSLGHTGRPTDRDIHTHTRIIISCRYNVPERCRCRSIIPGFKVLLWTFAMLSRPCSSSQILWPVTYWQLNVCVSCFPVEWLYPPTLFWRRDCEHVLPKLFFWQPSRPVKEFFVLLISEYLKVDHQQSGFMTVFFLCTLNNSLY